MSDPKKPPQNFFVKHRVLSIVIIVLVTSLINARHDIGDIIWDYHLHKAVSKSSSALVDYHGGTTDGHTYHLLIPEDFKEGSEKEFPDASAYSKSYKDLKLATVALEDLGALEPGDREFFDGLKNSSAKFIRDLRTSNNGNSLIQHAQFDKTFTEIRTDELQINYADTNFRNSDNIIRGSFILEIKNNEMYRLIVQSRHVYDKANPDFRQQAIDGFSVE